MGDKAVQTLFDCLKRSKSDHYVRKLVGSRSDRSQIRQVCQCHIRGQGIDDTR